MSKGLFEDTEVEIKVLTTRVQNNEVTLKEQVKLNMDHDDGIENFRKRLQKFTGDFEVLKRKTSSALEMSAAAANKEEGLKMEDLAGFDLSGDSGEKMTKMVQLLEQNFNRRIAIVEAKASGIKDLEEEISRISAEGFSSKPGASGGAGSGATPEQVAKWDANCTKSEELAEAIKQNQIELSMLEGGKLKSDITTLK